MLARKSAMTSNGFTLADPNDHGMLDVAGLDTSAPAVIMDFVRQ
jgi:60 kDa SS-A/Ro ribonucleoprotein